MLAPALLLAALAAPPDAAVTVTGQTDGAFRAGCPIAFTLAGPEVLSEAGDPNPFTDYTFTGTFGPSDEPGPDGKAGPDGDASIVVPGYFAADGNAAETGADSGDKWRVRYRPNSEGPVRYRLKLKKGDELIASAAGTIDIAGPPRTDGRTADFRTRGALHSRDGRLVLVPPGGQLRDATPFYKTGAGSPENLLAYADFDGTYSLKSRPRQGESHSVAPHRYAPHVKDWNDGDPTWGAGETAGRGKGLIGALNYLADAGANSLYFVPFNVAGDGRDVWPHAAPDGREPNDRTRFDCSKLDQWERRLRSLPTSSASSCTSC